MIGFVTWPPLYFDTKRWPSDKVNHEKYVCYKLLYVMLKKITSWPQLISKLLITPACLHTAAASDWPRTFLYPRCFCLA